MFLGGDVEFTNNVAAHGDWGFDLIGGAFLENNTAIDNSTVGFAFFPVNGTPSLFHSNSAISNGGPGVIFVGDIFDFRQNNFFGNDRNRPAALGAGQSARCGILNQGFALTPGPSLALDNFWGSAAGPQAKGPGDDAGGVCDQNGSATKANTFATTPFAITSLP